MQASALFATCVGRALNTPLAWPPKQVWVLADHRDGKLYWKADSDSQLTKVRGACGVTGQGWQAWQLLHL